MECNPGNRSVEEVSVPQHDRMVRKASRHVRSLPRARTQPLVGDGRRDQGPFPRAERDRLDVQQDHLTVIGEQIAGVRITVDRARSKRKIQGAELGLQMDDSPIAGKQHGLARYSTTSRLRSAQGVSEAELGLSADCRRLQPGSRRSQVRMVTCRGCSARATTEIVALGSRKDRDLRCSAWLDAPLRTDRQAVRTPEARHESAALARSATECPYAPYQQRGTGGKPVANGHRGTARACRLRRRRT